MTDSKRGPGRPTSTAADIWKVAVDDFRKATTIGNLFECWPSLQQLYRIPGERPGAANARVVRPRLFTWMLYHEGKEPAPNTMIRNNCGFKQKNYLCLNPNHLFQALRPSND